MKNTFLKTNGATALTVLILALFAQISIFAQEQQDINAEEKSDRLTEKDSLLSRVKADGSASAAEGSGSTWDVLTTFVNCQTGAAFGPPAASMSTFMADGTMGEFGISAGLFRSPAYGVWAYTGGSKYSNTFRFFRFNPDGAYSGKVIVRKQIELKSSNSFTAVGATEIYDTNGNLLMRGCTTETATRFQ